MRHLIFIVCTALFCSCDKQVEITDPAVCFPCPAASAPPTLEVSEATVKISGDFVVVGVYSNVKWKATLGENSWLSLDSSSGEGCSTLLFRDRSEIPIQEKQPVEVTLSAENNPSLKAKFIVKK